MLVALTQRDPHCCQLSLDAGLLPVRVAYPCTSQIRLWWRPRAPRHAHASSQTLRNSTPPAPDDFFVLPLQALFRGLADNDDAQLHCLFCRLLRQLCSLRHNAHRCFTGGAVFAVLSFLRRCVREADQVLAACEGFSSLLALEGARREAVSGGITMTLVDAQQARRRPLLLCRRFVTEFRGRIMRPTKTHAQRREAPLFGPSAGARERPAGAARSDKYVGAPGPDSPFTERIPILYISRHCTEAACAPPATPRPRRSP